MDTGKKTAVIVFLGNISFDTRCFNLRKSLEAEGIETTFIGFEWREKGFRTTVTESVKVYSLTKKYTSLFYYLKFYFLSAWHLFAGRYDYYFAEDVYTLPVVSFFCKLKKGRLFYDSRELFGFLAGLKGKKIKQNFWEGVEKRNIHKTDGVIVTGRMDGEFLIKQYGISEDKIILLRNLPLYREITGVADLRAEHNIPQEALLAIYQGVIVKGRGLDLIFRLLNSRPDLYLLVAGSGELLDEYKRKATESGAGESIIFTGNIPQEKLLELTAAADLGFALIENLSVSYYYALPNKMFEYIMAGVPAVVSNLPQMRQIIEEHDCGFVLDIEREYSEVISDFNSLIPGRDALEDKKEKCKAAAGVLCWENDFRNLKMRLG
ncbi:MAG: glycosyltransferase [Ignavibacteriaceae bacterium]|nr:glycosyltransferase [Ignavibacteriaceae bacterium]